jgi:hypothetical protein
MRGSQVTTCAPTPGVGALAKKTNLIDKAPTVRDTEPLSAQFVVIDPILLFLAFNVSFSYSLAFASASLASDGLLNWLRIGHTPTRERHSSSSAKTGRCLTPAPPIHLPLQLVPLGAREAIDAEQLRSVYELPPRH